MVDKIHGRYAPTLTDRSGETRTSFRPIRRVDLPGRKEHVHFESGGACKGYNPKA